MALIPLLSSQLVITINDCESKFDREKVNIEYSRELHS